MNSWRGSVQPTNGHFFGDHDVRRDVQWPSSKALNPDRLVVTCNASEFIPAYLIPVERARARHSRWILVINQLRLQSKSLQKAVNARAVGMGLKDEQGGGAEGKRVPVGLPEM